MSQVYQPTKTVQAAFILGLVLVIVIGLNFPFSSVVLSDMVVSEYVAGQHDPNGLVVTQAGFPWSFYTQVSGFGSTSTAPSVVAGLADLVATVVVFALVVFWLYCRYGEPTNDAMRWMGRRVSGVTFAAGIVSVVVGLTAYAIGGRRDVELRASAELGGNSLVTSGYVMSEYLSRRLPVSLRTPWKRVLQVELSHFDHSTLERVATFPYLTTVSLRRGVIDDQAVEELARLKMLRELTLRDVDCRDLTAAGVAKLSQLTTIDISHAEFSGAAASAIVSLPALRVLRAQASRDSIAQLGDRVSGSKIEVVELVVTPSRRPVAQEIRSKQAIGQSDLALAIVDAVNLKSLTIEGVLGSHVDLTLRNLPRLSKLNLADVNVVSFKAQYLPRLCSLGVHSQVGGFWSEDDYDFTFPLFDRIELSDCAILQELHLHSRYIESVEISNSPRLGMISLNRWPVRFDFRRAGEAIKLESDDVRCSRLVNQLSQVASLEHLEMIGVDLTNVDLRPLENLPRLTSLNVSDSKIDSNQALGFLAIKELDSLNLERTGTSGHTADALLCGSERWKKLLLEPVRFDHLLLTDQETLSEFFGRDLLRARRVVMKNVLSLDGQLQLAGRDIESLRIENAPRLRGIILEGDLPENAVISEVPRLEAFEANGRGVTDAILASVCESPNIRRLVCSNSSVTHDGLSVIAGNRSLVTLHLANSPVDDAIVEQWDNLPFLRDVVLDGTKITGKSVETLAKINNLQRLSLSHTNLKPEDLRPLENASTLIRLDVAGVGILPETLAAIAQSRYLAHLDISGVSVSDELFGVLVSKDLRRLSVLTIGGSGLTDTQVLALTQIHPNLVIMAPHSEFSASVVASLENDGRFLSGPIFSSRSLSLASATRVAQDLPYATLSTIEKARLVRSLDREARIPRSVPRSPKP